MKLISKIQHKEGPMETELVALDLDLDYSGNMIPSKNNKIALVDA